jgi:glycosyltransferase involved in cell wall biosynthesis
MTTGPRKRIVMLVTNPATFDQRPLKEAHFLCSAGKSVTVLAWDRELETKSDSVFPDGLVIKRLRLGAGHGTPVFTLPKLAVFYLWCLAHLLLTREEAIHCHDVDTLPTGFVAKILSLGRSKLVYDMHDLPEAFLRFFPLSKYTQKLFLDSAKKLADEIIVVNEKFVEYLGKVGFERSKLVVVMNAPPSNEGRGPRMKGSPFNVLYYGWLGEERGVRLLIDAMQGLEGVSLSLAGRGELTNYVRESGAKDPSIRYLGWLKIGELRVVIEKADLIPSLYEPKTKNALMATPGKLLTAMSLSVPSLVPNGTYQSEIVEKFGCGLVVDWKDPGDVRDAIRRLVEDDKLYSQLSAASYEAFRSTFSWEVMGMRLDESYDNLLTSSE